jgi:hypothetical protein
MKQRFVVGVSTPMGIGILEAIKLVFILSKKKAREAR